MAFTVSQVVSSTVWGNLRINVLNVTPDATTGTFDTGLNGLIAVIPTIKSMASFVNSGSTRNIGVFSPNLTASGAASNGICAITGCVANNVYTVVCLGKS